MARPLKSPVLRQRRNKPSTRRKFSEAKTKAAIPPLPTRRPAWTLRTRKLWEALWSEPWSKEYRKVGTEMLYAAIELAQQYWEKPSAGRHKEMRLAFEAFGVNPLSRRRLDWTIGDETDAPVVPQYDEDAPAEDPRGVLRMVPK